MKKKFFIEELSSKQKIFVLAIISLRFLFTPIALLVFVLYLLHSIIEWFLHYFPKFRGYFDARISIRKVNIVTTGGTGGHIFPAINFAMSRCLQHRMLFISDTNSLPVISKRNTITNGTVFNAISSRCGRISSLTLPIIPLKKRKKSIACLCKSMFKSLSHFIFYGFLFKKIIGFGGYASFPTLFWAVIFRKPIFLHEQNAVFGKVNLVFAIFARKIFAFFPVASNLHNIYNLGMPLSEDILSMPRIIKRIPTDSITILVISGTSGGAESVKPILSAIINLSRRHKNLHVLHQADSTTAKIIATTYEKHQITCEVQPFFNNIYEILPTVNICISRSGASSIVDLLAFGVPTIFIPLKTSADDHQMKNASWIVQNNFGFLHKPWESTAYNLTALLHLCLAPSVVEKMEYLGQIAIKRNASQRMHEEMFKNSNDYYA